MWPDSSFRELPLSLPARNQLAGVYEAVRSRTGLPPRTDLLDLLVKEAYRPDAGTYVPFTDDVRIKRMAPEFSKRVSDVSAPFPYQFFSNPLVIPEDYDTAAFDIERAPMPRERATNNGLLVVTVEFDGETPDQFEEALDWTRNGSNTPASLLTLDAELCRFEDYRGYCVVFSGRRSIQFHFVIATKHLKNAPWNRTAAERLQHMAHDTALLANAHERYWDCVADHFTRILKPSLAPDDKLRRVTQWRRTPWAVRVLEKPSPLGIPVGTCVPQIVIAEKIRSRAATHASGFMVPASFSLANPAKPLRTKSGGGGIYQSPSAEMLAEAREMCRAEWGDYPELVQIAHEGGEWVFQFKNHGGDRNPSTVARGDHRRLLICGDGHSLDRNSYFLPEGMTAQELGDHLAVQFGLMLPPEMDGPAAAPTPPLPRPDPSSGPGWLEDLRLYQRQFRHFQDPSLRRIEAAFPEPISDIPFSDLKDRYRKKLAGTLMQARRLPGLHTLIVQSGEGISKSTTLSRNLPELQFEAIMDRASDEAFMVNANGEARRESATGFAVMGFRSRDQAKDKAYEFRSKGKPVALVKTFSSHYEEVCKRFGIVPIPKDEFDEITLGEVLLQIKIEQEEVFHELEAIRRDLWRDAPFDMATLLVTTHKAAALWPISIQSRARHHPDFDPFASHEEHRELAGQFTLDQIVLDDPEPDDFVEILEDGLYRFITDQQGFHGNWQNKSRLDRLAIYNSLTVPKDRSKNTDFERFNELMRMDLTRLDAVEVDYDAIPFGNDQPGKGIYRPQHGKRFHIGRNEWLSASHSAHLTVITTERLVCEVAEKAVRKGRGHAVGRLNLTNVQGIYPIRVPVVFDKRTNGDKGEEKRVSALAQEVMASDENAVVISDGVKGVKGILTFQRAKGMNGLEDRNIYSIVRNLHPEKYAELNVLGQWLGLQDVIETHYADQINQAVGRNRGFRDNGGDTKTVVITSIRLWNDLLKRLQIGAIRSLLYIENVKPW